MKPYEPTEEDCKQYAQKVAKTLVERKYKNGSSKDTRRDSTPQEAKAIESIIYGSLLGYRYHGLHTTDPNAAMEIIANTAEYILLANKEIYETDEDQGHINTYDTIYRPIMEFDPVQERYIQICQDNFEERKQARQIKKANNQNKENQND
jgi:hypothetical protein